MTLACSGVEHLVGTVPPNPASRSFHIWRKPTAIGQFRHYLVLSKSTDTSVAIGICSDSSSASNLASAFVQTSSTVAGQALSTAAITTAVWNALGASFGANLAPAAYLNGGNKGASAGGFTVTGLDHTLDGGRPSDFTAGWAGEGGHDCQFPRVLSDLEFHYLGIGGNPRWLTPDRYWICKATQLTTVTDEMGNENLTCTSGPTAGASDPVIATYWTAAALPNQSYTQGSAVGSIDFTTKFDQTAAAVDYTASLIQLSAPGTPTTTTAAAITAARLVTVANAAAFSVNGYCSITNNATPTLILDISGNTLLLATPRTWAAADNVYPFSVSAKTFTFYTSGNTFSGTPAAGDVGTFTVIPRAVNTTTAALIADGPSYQITIASSGAAPSFSAGPTLTSANTDGYTFAATANQTATWYAVALLAGSATPTSASVKTGSPAGFMARFTQALTASVAGSLSLTALVLPKYDLYYVVDNGSGTSAASAFLAAQKLPPAGKQYMAITLGAITAITQANPAKVTVAAHGFSTGYRPELFGIGGMTQLNGFFGTITVVDANNFTLDGIDSTGFTAYTSGGLASWGKSAYSSASTLPATGDTGIWDAVSTPDGVPINPHADGSVELLMGSVTGRQSWAVDFYDVSGQALVGVATDYLNDVAPVVPTSASTPPAIFLPANQTIPATNIVTGLAVDVQGDALTVSVDTVPAGLAVSGQNVTGTTGSSVITFANATYTNAAGESATGQFAWVIGTVIPPNIQGLSQAQIQALMQALYLNVTFGQQDNPAAAGSAIAQNPPFGTPVQPNSTINVTLSTGVIPVSQVAVPDVSTNPTDQATASATLTAAGFTVVIPQPWTGTQKVTQYPTAGSFLAAGSVVSLFLTGGSPRVSRPRKRMKKTAPKNLQRASAPAPAPYILRRPKRR